MTSGRGEQPFTRHIVEPYARSQMLAGGDTAAQRVADILRHSMIDGSLPPGSGLPKQDDLIERFAVSAPTVRAALRILESEGLIAVRRGRRGGAIVLGPRVDSAAATLETVLRSEHVSMDELGAAIRQFEPVCVALCALRTDRHEIVLPTLRSIHDESKRCIDDAPRYTRVLRSFHESIVSLCGNRAVIIVIGALEAIWTAHANVWAEDLDRQRAFPDLDYRERALDDHELLLRLIDRGDADAAAREARQHIEWTPVYSVDDAGVESLTLLSPTPDRSTPRNGMRRPR